METLSDNEFEAKITKSEGFTLVDFWAPWCGPCKTLMPMLEEVLPQFPTLKAFSMNIDDNPETPTAHNIMSIPTLIVFKDGTKHETHVGSFGSAEDVKAWLKKTLT